MSLKYPPQWRAEDNFRLSLFGEPTTNDCFWRYEQAGKKKLPKQWFTTSKKDFKVYHAKREYYSHLDLLHNAFCHESSVFELKATRAMGIGVFAKCHIHAKMFRDNYSHFLQGFTTAKHIKKTVTLKLKSKFKSMVSITRKERKETHK